MKEEFEKLALAGKISRDQVNRLVTLATGTYCHHKSWGYGKITSVDTVFARFVIDFQTKAGPKPGHQMDMAFAADSLKPIGGDHIIARKMADLNAVRQMAALHHLDLIKLVLESFGGKATVEQIQEVLVPDVIADDWKKWWEMARREMKKDGHFQVPLKKSEPIVYQVQEVSLQQRLLKELRDAKGLKARIAVAAELLKFQEDLSDKPAAAKEAIALLNAEIGSHQRTQPALALEAVFMRDDLREIAALPPEEGELHAKEIWAQTPKLKELLEQLPSGKHKRTLHSFQVCNPEGWAAALLGIINHVNARICGEIAGVLIHHGKLAELKGALARLVSQHAASSELLLWLGKERSDSFADILGPEVFRAMLTAIERDQFNEKKSNRLRDFIMADQELIVDLLGAADLEVIKDVTRTLQLSASFDDMDRRSQLARIVKAYPAMQALVSGEQAKQEVTYIVSWESLERRKAEYQDLVQKKIPANSKDIAVARSYGDLRENHEYKAAKETQKVLMRRKGELERDLVRARGTDYSNPRTDIVSIGTHVKVSDPGSEHQETFTILGAWDGDPDKGIISYLTPVGQVLLNQPVGAEVDLELGGTKRHFRIDAIEAVQPAASVPAPAEEHAEAAPATA
ncbi:MAG TPA: GreA/GreB family elongation factor [Verrucomicrobiae bacterium]|jgi:transcription elongation GreA/GreB family factor